MMFDQPDRKECSHRRIGLIVSNFFKTTIDC